MSMDSLTPGERARFARMVNLALVATALALAANAGAHDSMADTLVLLMNDYRAMYPKSPRDGYSDLKAAAESLGIVLPVVEVDNAHAPSTLVN